MKDVARKVIVEVVTCCVFLSVLFIPWTIVSYIEHNYTRDTTVVLVSGSTITVEDNCGYLWEFEAEDERLERGVKVKVKMNDNCTSSIWDDEIWDYKIIK